MNKYVKQRQENWYKKGVLTAHEKLILSQCVEEKGLSKICKTCGYEFPLNRITYEFEVPCGTNTNEKPWGWADLVLYIKLNGKRNKYSILIEAKPVLEDLGAILRQIKSYRRFINPNKCVLVTYDRIPKIIAKALNNEGINFITFSGRPSIRQIVERF